MPALAVALPFAVAQGGSLVDAWPFLLAGLLGPGLSQLFFTFAVRDAGPSRTSVVVGTAPLFSVAIALVFLDEPLVAGLLLGALLIVAGGILLVSERGRPEHVRRIGLAFALAATIVFATRDNLVRWLAVEVDTDVEPALAAAATLGAGGADSLPTPLAHPAPTPPPIWPRSCRRASASGCRTSASSRRTTADGSRSSRRSSRPSRCGA